MKSIFEFKEIYLHRAPVDMRKNIYGLSALVKEEMKKELVSSSLFLFCNQRRNLLKMIYFDKSGFALWMKKLEESKFPWPNEFSEDVILVSARELEMLLSGINLFTKFKELHFEHLV